MKTTSYTFSCSESQQNTLASILQNPVYKSENVPHARIAVSIADCRINLYNSGKVLVQGKGAEDWVMFVLEPEVLQQAVIGYDHLHDIASREPHMGVDESGKGDFFGPLVVASAYTDASVIDKLRKIGVRDSKKIRSDAVALKLAGEIRKLLRNRCAVITVGPKAYNRMYSKVGNLNRMLAWSHARAIENLLDNVPDCPRALSDKFGPSRQIEHALMKKGRGIKLEQRIRAESDPAVAAASVLARAGFVYALRKMGKKLNLEIPKGASERVRKVAEKLLTEKGPGILSETAKCHFKTTDQVLRAVGMSRNDLLAD